MTHQTGLIVEDLPDSRAWLSETLQLAFPNIELALAPNLAEGTKCVEQNTPDIALIDLGLPDGSGIDLIHALHAKAKDCLIIVTSIFDDEQHLFSALRAGAKGYLLKDQSRNVVIDLLHGIDEGRPPLSPAIARKLLGYFSPPESDKTHTEAQLTERERDVLQLIAKGYTIGKTAELLGITRNTAAGYVKIIYRKLKVTSRAEATLEASRRGIISVDSH